MLNTLPKTERLSGKTDIDNLFAKGESFLVYPLRVVYLISGNTEAAPVKILVGVSKKRFKKAVDRNRIKRLLRESYRLNKSNTVSFFGQNNKNIHIAFFIISSEIPDFKTLQEKMKIALNKIIEKQ